MEPLCEGSYTEDGAQPRQQLWNQECPDDKTANVSILYYSKGLWPYFFYSISII